MNILILNIVIPWVYRLYEEYINSMKHIILENYKGSHVIIKTFDIDDFKDDINIIKYDKIFYSGDIGIFLSLYKKLLNMMSEKALLRRIYYINIEQMSHFSYYKMIRTLKDGINIIDYSEENIPYLATSYRTYLFPPYFKFKDVFINDKSLDVLSICNNDYRRNILEKHKNIHLLNECYGDIRDDFFKKTKIYINIHCSDEHKTMELIRIINLLSHKVIIISQKSINSDLLFVKDSIIICNNIDELPSYINEILSNYEYHFNNIFIKFYEKKYKEYIKINFDKIMS
jgi:hypothetical protein